MDKLEQVSSDGQHMSLAGETWVRTWQQAPSPHIWKGAEVLSSTCIVRSNASYWSHGDLLSQTDTSENITFLQFCWQAIKLDQALRDALQICHLHLNIKRFIISVFLMFICCDFVDNQPRSFVYQ